MGFQRTSYRSSGQLGFGLTTAMPVTQILRYARRAERAGFHSIWLSEDPYFRDALPIMGLLARAVKKATVGTCIINVYTKNPVYMAMAAATLDEIAGGRFVLGLGRGVRGLIEGELGVPYGSALEYLREYLPVVRALIGGRKVKFRGRMVKVSGSQLRFTPPRHQTPIYLAAMGPRMLQLAGKCADGVIFNSCVSVANARYSARLFRKAAEEAGKNAHDVTVAAGIWCFVAQDPATAITTAKPLVAFMLSIPTFGELFLDQNGFDQSILPHLRRFFKWQRPIGDPFWHLEHGDANRAAKLVSNEIVTTLTASGTLEDCRKRIQEYRSAGVDLPILFPVGASQESVVQLASTA